MPQDIHLGEKALAALPGGRLCTKEEAENIIQLFGYRLIDWRRLSDDDAGELMADLMRKHGPDQFVAALQRVRRLAGRERTLWLAAITSVAPPGSTNLVQIRPQGTDDELWRLVFVTFLYDEQRKLLEATQKRILDHAVNEQAVA